MSATVSSIKLFPLRIPRDVPYLGPLEEDNRPNPKGYIVRPGNRTVYPVFDQTLLVRAEASDGTVGWGECFGVVAPQVARTILDELLIPFVIGRSPHDVERIYEDLYDLQRVRGHFGGYALDAIAGLDMALWDLRGKLSGQPVWQLLGGLRHERLPVYVSGLPGGTKEERAGLGKRWIERGFSAVKFAAVVADEGEVAEIEAIRSEVGPAPKILADLHWRYTALEAVQLIERLCLYDLYLAEAPVAPEDLAGQAHVARSVKTRIGLGEEWRTIHEYLPRLQAGCMDVIQPEMAHTGITGFVRICELAQAFHCQVMPHATINIGIAQAASLHAAATLANFVMHEYQHSIFDRNKQFIRSTMDCRAGFFTLPDGPGLGVEPTEEALNFAFNQG
ncbi:MAG: mandelate racemase/muconate lactonizing enzyme family protein [Caldilineaceae bacterium SB0661_bin_32]|uniref:Mandelate racemase/muconate lactonizing enzyme family protein n=1 Tax=Caldilineaceae bacterium SB0661_bin_32 TaxID=2605255 RepID=A0A6B1D3K6_9CHLR|nr:mandelate racemase/muconate lactonizing enzyme family protein [Caldilineaceae bacterium SB0661_bin_32]